MFDHVTICAFERTGSERFYATVLRTLGVEPYCDEHVAEWREFSLASADPEHPVTCGLHIGFAAPSRAHVDEFWRAGNEGGYRDDGAPGPRPQYGEDYDGGFLLDPDGNSAEAVHHGTVGDRGLIDHLWIRVGDVPRAQRFYETVAPYAGFRLNRSTAGRAQFTGESGSFSVV